MDWSTLPPDLVHHVSRRLHDPLDFLRLRAVCRSWRAAAPLSSPPRFLPWLLSLPDPRSFLLLPTTPAFSFFSLSSRTIHNIPTPAADAMHLLGPTRGRLLLSDSDHKALLLLNPLTGDQATLPPTPFSSAPIQGYTAEDSAVMLYNTKNLCFYRPEVSGNRWTEMPVDLVCENMYHMGKVFVSNAAGYVAIVDAATLAEVAVVPPLPLRMDAFKCFVPSEEELLCVVRYFVKEDADFVEDCCGFEVYRLELAGDGGKEAPQWVRMRDIGDRMLFVGLYQGFSFRAGDFAGFEGNCIYFFKLARAKRCFIYRFSLVDGHIEEIPGPWIHGGTWFVPSLS